MCVSKTTMLNLCDLFPQTAENIKRKSLERRHRFMQVKQSYEDERNHRVTQKVSDPKALVYTNEDNLKNFQPDEERAEKTEDQKEDMNKYLTKLNRKIDALISAHAEAEKKIVV